MNNEEAIADLLARAQPRTKEVRVCTRGDLVARHEAIVEQMASAPRSGSLGGNPELAALADELEAIEAEQEECTLAITVSSVSRRAWANVVKEHPPAPGERGAPYNQDTFPPAAVALAAGVPVEQVEKLAEALTPGEFGKLFDAAVNVNASEMPHPKAPAALIELARANGRSSTTADPEASPAAGS